MEKNEHSIQRLKLDLTLRGSENSQGMEAHLNEILRDRIFKLLEAELDRIDVSGQRLRIDQLELNLGAIPSKIVDEEFPVRFVERLKEKLTNFEVAEAKSDDRIEESRTHLDAIRHYFKEGAFPWWFSVHKTHSLDELVQEVLGSNHAAMAQVIKGELHNRNFLKRLTGQLQIVTLQRILKSITPSLKQPIFAQVDELFQVLSQAYESKLESSHAALGYQALFEQLILGASQIQSASDAIYHSLSKLAHVVGVRREVIVATLLKEQKLNRHSAAFVKSLGEVKNYDLADDKHDTLAAVLKRKKQAPNFKGQFDAPQDTSDAKPQRASKPKASTEHDRETRILLHYLQNGSLPIWAAEFTPQQLSEEILEQVVGHTPKLLEVLIANEVNAEQLKARWLRLLQAIAPVAQQKVSFQVLNDLQQLRIFLKEGEWTQNELQKQFKHIEQISQTLLFYDGVVQAEDSNSADLGHPKELVEEIREVKDEEDVHDELSSMLSDAQIGVTEGALASKEEIAAQLEKEIQLINELSHADAEGISIEKLIPNFIADVLAFFITQGKWPWWMNLRQKTGKASDIKSLGLAHQLREFTSTNPDRKAEVGQLSDSYTSQSNTMASSENNDLLLQLINRLGRKDQNLVASTLAKLVEHEMVLRRVLFQLPEKALKALLKSAVPELNESFWKRVSKMTQRIDSETQGNLSQHNFTALIAGSLLRNIEQLQTLSTKELEGIAARVIRKTLQESRVVEVADTDENISHDAGSEASSTKTEKITQSQHITQNKTSAKAIGKAIAALEKSTIAISDEIWEGFEKQLEAQSNSSLFRKLSAQQVLAHLMERGSLPAEGTQVSATDFAKLLQRTAFETSFTKGSKKSKAKQKSQTDSDTVKHYLKSPKAQAFIFNVLSEQVLDEMLADVLEKHKKGFSKAVASFTKLLRLLAAEHSDKAVAKGIRKALFQLLSQSKRQLTANDLFRELVSGTASYFSQTPESWKARWLFALHTLKSSAKHSITKDEALKPLFSKSFKAKLKPTGSSLPKSTSDWAEFVSKAGVKKWSSNFAKNIGDRDLATAIEAFQDAAIDKKNIPRSLGSESGSVDEVTSSSQSEQQTAFKSANSEIARDLADTEKADKVNENEETDSISDVAGSQTAQQNTVDNDLDQASDETVHLQKPDASQNESVQHSESDRIKAKTDQQELGHASIDNIEEENDALEYKSPEKGTEQTHNIPTDEEALEELRKDPQVCMDTLYFFLVFGNLPWWSVFADIKALEQYVRQLAKAQPELFKAHLERLLNDRLVGNRLRDFFEDLLDVQSTQVIVEESTQPDVQAQEQMRKSATQEVKVLDWLLQAEGVENTTVSALQEYLPIYLRHLEEQGISLADQPALILQMSAQLLSIRLGKSYAEVLELLQQQIANWQSNALTDEAEDKQALRLSMEQVAGRLQKQLEHLQPNAETIEAVTSRFRAVDHTLFEGDNEVFMRFIGQHLLSKFEPEEFSIFFNLLNFSRGEQAPNKQLESLFTNALYYLSIREQETATDMVKQLYASADADAQSVVQQLKAFSAVTSSILPSKSEESEEQSSNKESTENSDIEALQSHIEARLLSEFTSAFLKLAPKLNFGNYHEQLHTVFYLAMARPISRNGVHQAIRDFLKVVAQKEQKDIKSILIYLLDQVDRAEGRPYKYLPQLLRHSLGELALGKKLIPQFAKQELEPVLTTFNYALYHEQSERLEWIYESAATYLALKMNKTANELAHDILVNVDPGQAMRHGTYYRILERVANKTRTDLSKAEQRLLNAGGDLQEILRRKEHTYRIMDLIAELTLLFERVVPELNLTPYLRGTNKDWYVLLAHRGSKLDIDALLLHWFQELVSAERYAFTELLKYLLEYAKTSAYTFANLSKLFVSWLNLTSASPTKSRTRSLPAKAEQDSTLEVSIESKFVQEDKAELLQKFTEALDSSDYLLEEILDNTLATFHDEEGLRKEYEEMLLDKHDWGDNEQADDKLYISNAGIVLVWPFLPRFFNNLGYLEKGQFKGREFQERAVHVLQYLADARENVPEYTLMLNKLMCGMEVKEAIKKEVVLTEQEKHECEVLLKTVIVQWDAVKNTPVDAFRQSFFQREGALFLKNGKWNLNVERKAYDVILKTLPWGLSLVRFSWSENVIYLEWKA